MLLVSVSLVLLLAACTTPAPAPATTYTSPDREGDAVYTSPDREGDAVYTSPDREEDAVYTQAPTPTPPPGAPIKIGASLPLTGFIPEFGEAGIIGNEFALDEYGWEVAGRPIEYIYEDNATTSDKAIETIRKMVEVDNVDVVFAPVLSGLFWRVQPYTDEKGMLLISQWGRYDFRPWEEPRMDITSGSGSGTQTSYPMGAYAYEELGIKTVATMAYDVESGYMVIGGFADGFTKAGGEVVSMQWLPFGVVDYGPYFLAMGEPDAVVIELWGMDQLAAWEQFFEFGLHEKYQPLLAIANNLRYEHLPALGDAALGMYGAIDYEWTIDTPANRDFVARFEAEHGFKPHINYYDSYITMKLYLDAVKATGGNTTPAAVRDAIIGHSFEGPAGTLTFTKTGYALRNTYIVEVQKIDGQLAFQVVKTVYAVPDAGYYTKEAAEAYWKR